MSQYSSKLIILLSKQQILHEKNACLFNSKNQLMKSSVVNGYAVLRMSNLSVDNLDTVLRFTKQHIYLPSAYQ